MLELIDKYSESFYQELEQLKFRHGIYRLGDFKNHLQRRITRH